MISAVWEVEPEIKARDRGMARAESANWRNVQLAREIARELAKDGAVICADHVRAAMLERFPDTEWGNWAGRIFAGGAWAFVGFTKSTAPGSHSNLLRTWRFKR